MDRLGISLEHVHILGISKHILKALHLQLLSQCSRPSFMRQGILSRVVRSLWASRVVVQEVDLQGDLVAENLRSHPLLSRLVVGRPECLL